MPSIGWVAAPALAPSPSSPFHPPQASHLGRSDVPVPDDPYLGTALPRRQAGNVSGWQTSMHRAVSWAAPAALHDTAPVQSPACRALPAVIALHPGIWPQHSQTQSFVSPSLPGLILLQFLRDFLSAPFPISSLVGRGLDNALGHVGHVTLAREATNACGTCKDSFHQAPQNILRVTNKKKDVIYGQQARAQRSRLGWVVVGGR